MHWGKKSASSYDPSSVENIKKAAAEVNKMSANASSMTPYIVNGIIQGYTDSEGHYFAGNSETAMANKTKFDISQTIDKNKKIVPNYSKYTVVPKGTVTPLSMLDKVVYITSDSINKGKSFISKLFARKEKKISYD